jgi:hypothetical protein
VDTLNIQQIPTPIFYLGRRNIFRYVQEQPAVSRATIRSANVLANQFSAVADDAGSAGSIVSALYIAPFPFNPVADAAASAASIISATETGTEFQRNVADEAESVSEILSAFIFTPYAKSGVDMASSVSSLISATVMNSTQYALADFTPLSVNFAHGLAAPPAYIRIVLLCTSNDVDSGIVAGQEVAPVLLFEFNYNQFEFGADATKIYLGFLGGNGGAATFPWAGASAYFTSISNFSLKVYWQ